MKIINTGFPNFREIKCYYGFERSLDDGTINHYFCKTWYHEKSDEVYVSVFLECSDNLYCFMGTHKLYLEDNKFAIYYRGFFRNLEEI